MMSRVAVVHEWLSTIAGSERVVEQILRVLPDADLFTLVDVLPERERGFLGRTPRTSFIQRIPFAARHFRALLPLLPLAIEQFDLSSYDIVISSSHAFAKGILTGPDQLHVCYCHTPMRYAWELQHQYLREAGLHRGIGSWVVRVILHYLRLWDTRTAHGVDCFVANSRFVAARIRKTYGRDAVVIHPPVNVDFFQCRPNKEQFYLAASRFVPYKRMDLIMKAFASMPERRLVVVGDGPDWKRCKALATPNVEILGGSFRVPGGRQHPSTPSTPARVGFTSPGGTLLSGRPPSPRGRGEVHLESDRWRGNSSPVPHRCDRASPSSPSSPPHEGADSLPGGECPC